MEKFRIFYKDEKHNLFSWFDGFFSDIDTYIEHLSNYDIIAVAVHFDDEENKEKFKTFCSIVNSNKSLLNED